MTWRVKNTYKLLIYALVAHWNWLDVSHELCDDSVNQFLMAVLLVLKYQEEREVTSQLPVADVMYALRTVVSKEMGELTAEFGVHGSLPRLSGLLEVIGRSNFESEQR